MKKIALISAIAISGLLYNTANAQVRLSFGIRFNHPGYIPARVVVQEPVVYNEPVNYDGDEDYYYLPEVDAYYSVPEQCYYYNDGGEWVSAAYLPGAYHDFDWRSARRYEVRAPRPYMHNDYYRTRYSGVAFSGHWDGDYNRGYAGENHYYNDQYRRNDQRFDNDRNRWGYSQRVERYRDQRFDNNRGQDNRRNDEHFDNNRGQDNRRNDLRVAQNNFQRNDRGERDNHRQGRF